MIKKVNVSNYNSVVIVLQYNVIGMTGSTIATSIGNTIETIHMHILEK